ncbi:MAG: NUDIX hydrolase [Gemmatimonadetes bacterium]|nr:NUDIX hydrolase [Gemmatimonadota bacterium]
MNVKRSVALVIRDAAQRHAVLLVQRPPDDEDLPGVWGLPAATLAEDESPADAARRAGRDKLGVELEAGRLLNEGSAQRAAYRLDMQLLEARILGGTPVTDAGGADGTTRYQAWRWGAMKDLASAAARGSLCSRLALELETDR